MKKTSKAKTRTSSAAENITLEVPNAILTPKTNGNGKHPKNGKQESNLSTDEIDDRELLKLLLEVKEGNFSVRMPGDKMGISGKICDTLNSIIQLNEALVEELNMARNTIGLKGHLNHR